MRALLHLALCGLASLAVACERIDVPPGAPPAGEQTLQHQPSELVPAFARSDARLTVAHRGLRRVEFAAGAGQGSSYRERITTDGAGHYAIVPVDAPDSDVADWAGFELLQRAREGFLFRYRDFLVRDRALFARNWRTTELDQDASVAGRSCVRYRVERVTGKPLVFELSADAETGLVLACDELDADGNVVASMVYESFQISPDLRSVAWHVGANDERALDLRTDLAAQLGVAPLVPRLLPDGYASLEAATVSDGNGGTWLKLAYTDGVQPLFLFQKLGDGSAASLPGTTISASSVAVFQVGSATVIQGTVEGHELFVIGKAPQAELLDLIESALP